jgi:hypothetical protein
MWSTDIGACNASSSEHGGIQLLQNVGYLYQATHFHNSKDDTVLVQKPPNKHLIQILYNIYASPLIYISVNTSQKLMCPIQFQSLLILFSLPNNIPYSSNNKASKPFKSFWRGTTSLWQTQFTYILISQICFTCKPNSMKIAHLQSHCIHFCHCTMNAEYLISSWSTSWDATNNQSFCLCMK